MARSHFRDLAMTRSAGNALLAVPNPTITLYEAGTSTPLAQTIYAARTGGATLPNPFTGESDGTVEFWLDAPQDVRIVISGSLLGVATIDYVAVVGDLANVLTQNMTAAATVAGGFTATTSSTTAYGVTAKSDVVGYVASALITAGGASYTTPPAVSFPGGAGATGTAGMGVGAVTVTNGGAGYSNSFAVTFTGGGGSGAAGTATAIAGVIQSVAITSAGSGYTSVPTPVFTAGGGSGGAGTSTLKVVSITVTAGGSGYTATTVSFTGGGGSGAAAYADINGARSLRVLDPSGAALLEIDRHTDPLNHVNVMDVLSLKNGLKFNIDSNGGYLFDNRQFSITWASSNTDDVVALFHYTNSSPSGIGTPDVEPMGIIAVQAAGTDSYLRAVEIDTISNTTTSNWPKIGAEISAQFAAVGNTKDYAVGVSIRNLGGAWGIPIPKRGDSAIAVGSDQYGWENAFLYRDIDALITGDGPLLFKITKTGSVSAASHVLPVTDGAANLGSTALRWGFVNAYDFWGEAGLASAPTFAFRNTIAAGAETTGVFLQIVPSLGWGVSVNGAQQSMLTSAGLALEAGISWKAQTVKTGVISPAQLTANTDNWSPTGLATASLIRLSTDASRNLTGIAAQAAGTELTLMNVGTQNCVLVHQATSTAANQFKLPGGTNITLGADAAVTLWYDGTTSRWRVKDR